jgi:hypothetical protein
MSSKYDDSDDEGKYNESKSSFIESKKSEKLSSDELITKVQKYFYEDPAFAKTFEDFVSNECEIIDLETEEYKLEYTTVYNKYKNLFEEKMEDYIDTLGSTIYEFYNALKNKSDEDPDGVYSVFGQILVSVTDFDIFMIMMREMAQSKAKARRRK